MIKKKVKTSDIFELAFKLEDALGRSKRVIENLKIENTQLKNENSYLKRLLEKAQIYK